MIFIDNLYISTPIFPFIIVICTHLSFIFIGNSVESEIIPDEIGFIIIYNFFHFLEPYITKFFIRSI